MILFADTLFRDAVLSVQCQNLFYIRLVSHQTNAHLTKIRPDLCCCSIHTILVPCSMDFIILFYLVFNWHFILTMQGVAHRCWSKCDKNIKQVAVSGMPASFLVHYVHLNGSKSTCCSFEQAFEWRCPSVTADSSECTPGNPHRTNLSPCQHYCDW